MRIGVDIIEKLLFIQKLYISIFENIVVFVFNVSYFYLTLVAFWYFCTL